MPNTKSAKKRLRQDNEKRARNRAVKSNVRGLLRKVREAVEAGDSAVAEEAFQKAVKKLDQAGAKKVIHPNAVARYKSRLSKKIKGLKQPAS